MRCRVLWSGEEIGVVELWSWLHLYMYMYRQLVPGGWGGSCKSSISISFFHLPSFLPSFLCQQNYPIQSNTCPVPTVPTVPAISYFLWLTGYISEVTGNMKFSWLLSFFLLTLSINQIIPTTNNPRFCMMITTNLPKPTHQKTLVCVIIFFPSPTVTNYMYLT